MLEITNYQRNADQNHNVSHLLRLHLLLSKSQKEMGVGEDAEKGNLCSQLLGL